jgi:hypothetical protein
MKFLKAFPFRKASLQETLIVALHKLAIDLAHQFERNTHCNQNGGACEWKRLHVSDPQNDVRQNSNEGHK